ncbi:(deoxy)nucleoside triphosphate pyrophosphohydrolase [Paenibacillus illinoisensis]|uniref:8-oxo-dGTP diphosphatase n=1 Tax=Paenibacillus illinoisensis TaxID=59845 RepID=A0A2W0CDZ8_9BACL|nr:(deoxy)nucleoside triphosphate pyrophosphohydrolase [Paenibacillus illinoisensis]PYY31040.1 Mutator MutT protein [Paenibacillus illinoisensis]
MKQVNVVGAVITNDHNQVLCALRSQQMSQPGYWEFPGGKIEQDENPKDALIREIREELLCDIEVGEHIKEVVYDYPNLRVNLITYYARLISGVPFATEHESLKWVSFDDIESLRWAPADIPTVNILSENERSGLSDTGD